MKLYKEVPKPKRKRTVEPLHKREEERAKNAPPEQQRIKLRGDPPRDPDAPQVFVAKDTVYRSYVESVKNFPWLRLAVTFIVILLGGVGSAAFQARNANIRRDIRLAENELREHVTTNIALESQLQERYAFHEIERIAQERLGMDFPDPAQIINIYVPRAGGATLNVAEYALPQHNYFWNDVRNFLSGLFNQIFGGSN